MPNKSNPVPPTSRRSARQERLASREANRQLSRAGTRSSGGGDIKSLLLWTVAAVAIGAIVIGGAYMLTKQPSSGPNMPSPMPPKAVIPADIPVNGRTLGRADAPVTLDLYSDFQCPACQKFSFEISAQLFDNYVRPGKVKMVWHDFTIVDEIVGGRESLDAANAALCANDQGKFWPYHDWLYANQFGEGEGAFSKDRLKYMGAQAGLRTADFNACVDDGRHEDEVAKSNESLPEGVRGTPSIVINGKVVSSYAYADVKAAIEAALNPAASPSPSASASASASPS